MTVRLDRYGTTRRSTHTNFEVTVEERKHDIITLFHNYASVRMRKRGIR